jgi:hypothetical protein
MSIDFANKEGQFYYIAARFKGEGQSRKAHRKAVSVIDGSKANVGPYRMLIDGDYYVIIVGEVPSEDIRRRLGVALREGEPMYLEANEAGKEILRICLKRREDVLSNPQQHQIIPGSNGDVWIVPDTSEEP